MKKLLIICLIMATIFTVNAQDNKPTKEQTFTFIKDYLQNNSIQCSDYSGSRSRTRDIQSLSIDFDETKNLMIVYYEFHYLYRNTSENLTDNSINKYKFIIDLSKIESIGYSIRNFEECSFIYLNLKVVPNASIDTYKSGGYDETKEFPTNPIQVKDIGIPINNSCKDCEFTEADRKILKAFNHLRKLCGAPEAISFD